MWLGASSSTSIYSRSKLSSAPMKFNTGVELDNFLDRANAAMLSARSVILALLPASCTHQIFKATNTANASRTDWLRQLPTHTPRNSVSSG